MRRVFDGNHDPHPPVIVRVADAADVAAVLAAARDNGVEVAIRSGGHDNAGLSSTESGVVIDVRDLRELRIDPDRRRAVVGAGLTAVDIVRRWTSTIWCSVLATPVRSACPGSHWAAASAT